MEPVRFAVIGLGGYGRWITELILNGEDRQPPLAKLVAAADPNFQSAKHYAQLQQKGVKLFTSIDDVLKLPEVEAVWLPVPIDLHRPFVEKAVKAGKAVVVEKPVTGTVDDLQSMIAVRDQHGGKVAVGFQDIYADTTVRIKQELVGGAIGTIRSATVHACTPRAQSYYRRNAWAGKMNHNGTWVLDSPANNAVAHYINLALFFLGKTLPAMAKLESVTAELYRVYDVENYDTCSLRIVTEGGVPMLVHFTHAAGVGVAPHVIIYGDRGSMRYVSHKQATFESGSTTRVVELKEDIRFEMLDKLVRWIRGDKDVIVSTLEGAGAQLTVINGASEAAPVNTIGQYETKPHHEGDLFHVLPAIDAIFARASAEQKMLNELGDIPWAVAGQTVNLRNYRQFKGPKGK